MAYDYDKLYRETHDALGKPTAVFVEFFDRYENKRARILDVGCGQGRDALFIARHGHSVVGVDISPSGIRDLNASAKQENLDVQGVVADIEAYVPEGDFDVILIDRTLHMLPKPSRLAVLTKLLDHVKDSGWVLIADEVSNIKAFVDIFAAHKFEWTAEFGKLGYLFISRS
ncbi:class I SAM-dependent methyltransferase [Aliiroseovarius sp. M344]|uniref:class I SAM-dependent methyltransferase n=1 Tax=Aliiroseovarius sp. M344 TaxID=2867010 RepID=UPI0021AD96BE|nr:class I SAM-dependent methyltransferase [Aliiroseovarius sp. M344]UWQ13803.1 class I SAM-dependent methyltransferase [Aliiroseovarius sp. M344]